MLPPGCYKITDPLEREILMPEREIYNYQFWTSCGRASVQSLRRLSDGWWCLRLRSRL